MFGFFLLRDPLDLVSMPLAYLRSRWDKDSGTKTMASSWTTARLYSGIHKHASLNTAIPFFKLRFYNIFWLSHFVLNVLFFFKYDWANFASSIHTIGANVNPDISSLRGLVEESYNWALRTVTVSGLWWIFQQMEFARMQQNRGHICCWLRVSGKHTPA